MKKIKEKAFKEIDDLFELECDEIMFIDETLKQSIIEELTEQNNTVRLQRSINLCKEVALCFG